MLPLAGRRLWLPDPLPPELCVALRGGLLSPPPPGKLVHLFFAAAACKGCPATGGRGGGCGWSPRSGFWFHPSQLLGLTSQVQWGGGWRPPQPRLLVSSSSGQPLAPPWGSPPPPCPHPHGSAHPHACPNMTAHGGHAPSWSRWVTVRPPAADVDECAAETPPCGDGQYCENSRGAFTCEGAETPPPRGVPPPLTNERWQHKA